MLFEDFIADPKNLFCTSISNFLKIANKDIQHNFFKVFGFSMLLVYAFFDLLTGIQGDVDHVIIFSILFGVSVLAFMFQSRSRAIFQGIILITAIGFTVFLMSTVDHLLERNQEGRKFMAGNFIGVIEVFILMILKNKILQIIFILLSTGLKIIMVFGVYSNSVEVILEAIAIGIFVIVLKRQGDFLQEKSINVAFRYYDMLGQFKELVAEDLNHSLIILSDDFKKIIFMNQEFKRKFHAKDDSMALKSLSRINLRIQKTTGAIKSLMDSQEELIDAMEATAKKTLTFSADFTRKILRSTTKGEDDGKQGDNSGAQTTQKTQLQITMKSIIWDFKPCFCFFMDDVTEKELIVALSYADKQKESLIATVSHELRTPINGVMGMINLARDFATDNKQVQYLKHAVSCCKLLLYLVNAILDINQIRANKLKMVHDYYTIDHIFEELQAMYQFQSIQKKIELKMIKTNDVPYKLYGDMYRIMEVLTNLIGNAFKFTTKGHIKVNVELIKEGDERRRGTSSTNQRNQYNANYRRKSQNIDFEDEIRRAKSKKYDRLRFSVEDTGIGIKPEDKVKLFQAFGKLTQQNKNVNSMGVGLGLVISDQLVRKFNQNIDKQGISVDSVYGQGTTFSFLVPFKKECFTGQGTLDISSDIEDDEFDLREQQSDKIHKEPRSFRKHDSAIQQQSQQFMNNLTPLTLQKTGSENDQLLSHRSVSTNRRQTDIVGTKGFQQKSLNSLDLLTQRDTMSMLRDSNGSIQQVLIVDDNLFNLMSCENLLKKMSLESSTAGNGQECIDMIIEAPNEFKLILMDLAMPIMDGFEATTRITQMKKDKSIPEIPIVGLSADVRQSTIKKCKEAGMVTCLQKPFENEEMKKILRKCIPAFKG